MGFRGLRFRILAFRVYWGLGFRKTDECKGSSPCLSRNMRSRLGSPDDHRYRCKALMCEVRRAETELWLLLASLR